MTIAHPLETPWTFYYFQRPPANSPDMNYEESIHKIGKVFTCEEFWSIYSHLIRPDKLPATIALHLFRGDSRAMWEDADNIKGGSFLLRLPKGQVKFLWEKLLLAMISEQFPGDVNGAAVSTRPKVDLYIWHRTASNEVARMEICSTLWRELGLPHKTKIDYSPFSDMMNTSASKTQIQYIIESDGPAMKIMTKGKQDA
ncbi:Eukaryotic translation initiation factor NCBP [Tritrichomonas foetus]|uniref:Eukaryotic translation initiation factor NCBP n=1 Tax=Tritrichomonas foetus TaxID=1144522 RepID=A0A1J4L5Y7_9EUKA|nr:Eukaryotic translation initiation factor NCBP [Tritrichomonas foetus]|eukprot:OHT17366.1 Eukaryotic translation initiation factor NCBP [Tritrichomonas foetus]